MSELYRSAAYPCPACPGDAPLREFHGRLLCDTCQGMLCTRDDLATAIEELAGMAVELELFREKPGARACPRCPTPMTTSRLRLGFPVIAEHPKTRPTLDHCEAHGFWFDAEELAAVFEVVVKTTGRKGASGMRGPAMRPGAGRGWGFGQ